jgi:hypothetical protein
MWNDCIKIYEKDDFIVDIDREMLNSFHCYINIIRHEPKLQVWYDTLTQRCFGPEQDFYANPNEFFFFAQKEKFYSNPTWGKKHVSKYLGSVFGSSVLETTEYIIQNSENLQKFKDKKILIVGAGPSAADLSWADRVDDYDFVWSCNNFFKNKCLKNIEVALAGIGPNVDIRGEEFISYMNAHNTICTFEGGISPFRDEKDMSYIEEFLNNRNRAAYYHLRYFGKIGTVPRLICLATFLGAKEVHFVGVDGIPFGWAHTFEGDEKVHDIGRIAQPRDVDRRQFVILWDYLLNDLKDNTTKYQNLGEGHPANQLTDITKKEFPLIK